MSKKDEALKLAQATLEAIATHGDLACVVTPDGAFYLQPAITALREAQAEHTKTRPVESDYTSQVAYTRALEAYCDGLAEQPAQQEPVAFLDWYDNAHWGNEDFKAGCWRAWDAALAQRKPLTFSTLCDIEYEITHRDGDFSILNFARAIEAKLKEKNT